MDRALKEVQTAEMLSPWFQILFMVVTLIATGLIYLNTYFLRIKMIEAVAELESVSNKLADILIEIVRK